VQTIASTKADERKHIVRKRKKELWIWNGRDGQGRNGMEGMEGISDATTAQTQPKLMQQLPPAQRKLLNRISAD
jgi:hypothetical protein